MDRNAIKFAFVLTFTMGIADVAASDFSADGKPLISLVCESAPPSAVEHGLRKLSEALQQQGVSYERVESLNVARGQTLLEAICHNIPDFSARVLAIVVTLPLTTTHAGGFGREPWREWL